MECGIMITADMQLKSGQLVPFSEESKTLLKDLQENQVVKAKITGIRKPRSVRQLRMFWACCRTVSDNTEDENWNNPDKVCIQIKLALQFYKHVVVAPSGSVHFELGSISFENLSQVMANNIFDRAWKIMAKKIGVSVDDLLANAERYS